MITEEDKKRIKSEEIFRAEVVKRLEKAQGKSKAEKAWDFFNSPIGLWVLSTVVVGLAVSFYNDFKLNSEMKANNSALMQRITTETSHRLQKFRFALSGQGASSLYYENSDLAYMIDGTLVGDGHAFSEKPIYIFPEFKERTMHSLLYEMEKLTDDKSKSNSIKAARNLMNQIVTRLLNFEDPPRHGFSLSQRISMLAQTQPENLTQQDSVTLEEYNEKVKQFEQGELAEYHRRVELTLDSLYGAFTHNKFLDKLSGE